MGVGTLNVRAFWPWDTAAKPIPAGWTRDTDFDDRFLQGSDNTFAGAANGGGAHNHTDPGHTHVGDSHTHPFEATAATCQFTTVQMPGDPPPPNVYITADRIHAHVSATSNPATITYSNDAVTINNADMKPPWIQAIIIKPDDIGQDIPDDAVCFGDEATPPTGFSVTDGTGGTSDLDDRFIIGAPLAGGGTGGSATHAHTSPVHDHDPDDHEHAAKLCGYASATISCRLSLPLVTARPSRHHNVTLTTKALADVSDVAVTIQTASSEPAYIKLLGIQNTSGGATTPPGVILPFVGAYVDLPASGEWILCDGAGGTQDCTDRQVKITTSTDEIGDTGGSNTHTHTVTDHKHTHGAHNHSTSRVMTGTGYVDSGLTRITRYDHGATTPHDWIVGNATPTMQDAIITLSTDDGRFDYRTVIWVKYAPADVTVHLRGGHLRGGAIAAA